MKYNSLGLKSLSWIAAFTHKAEAEETEEDKSQGGMFTGLLVCNISCKF